MRDLRFVVRVVRVAILAAAVLVMLPGCPGAPDLPASDGSPLDAAIDGPLGDATTDTRRMDAPGDTSVVDVPLPPDAAEDAGPPECAIDTDCSTADLCETAVCTAGRCVRALVDCGDGDSCTDDVCDGLTGSCSNPRSADGTVCATGECCAGACIDVGTDPGNCGACGVACGANAYCGTGACVCASGFLDCDAAAGCEVSADVDPSNCGTCGMTCTAPTPSCLGGACGSCSTGADCADDGLSCTDAPTCAAGLCSYPLLPGSCLVAGGCYAAGAVSPADACLGCEPTASTTAFSPLPGATCDDGMFCTDADVCDAAGGCAGVNRACDDGLACTTDACNESLARCDNRARAGQCAIDGACWRSGDPNPLNPACQFCGPATGAYTWSALDGAACDDGAFCTVADSCDSAGACGGLPRACADTLSCTVDACDEASSACVNPTDKGSCLIGGVCYAAGATNPASVCQICDPLRGNAVWSANDGASCDDGAFCTVSDTCDTSAACIGTPRVCDDALSCTNDACNETTDRCDVLPQMDFCAIGGTCYPNAARNPLNDCEACIAAQSGSAWSPRTAQSCDDTAYCTEPDTCSSAAVCAGPARDCDDGLACTTDSCNSGARRCDNALVAGSCVIGGVCYAAGDANPANACQACTPSTSTSAWSARTGTACDDGQFCTTADACSAAAACVGVPRSCADTLSCTVDTCDEAADACVNTLQADFCSIAGACYANGTQNLTNTCLGCDSAASVTAWTPRTGVSCDDGLFCTPSDTCNAAGVCTGAARDCSDPDTCTLDTCNEATDACDHSLSMGFCTIGGTCYAATATNPANGCEGCDPTASTTAWTVRTGQSCDDTFYCTTGDTCSSSATCSGLPRSCTDSLACTNDSCNEGADRCDSVLLGGNCLIAGTCYADATVDSTNACQSCQSASSTTAWSPRTGTACTDGQFCTVGDACNAAANCVGSANLCSDALTCTTDTCDETSDSCASIVSSGCRIAGACYATGAVNAGNGCEVCDPARSTSGWSANVGAVCNDGLYCTTGDACNGSAACAGAPRNCADSLSCTVDSCDEAADACVSTVQADTCAIGGTCYSNGVVNPTNFCQACIAAATNSAWSPRTGTVCDDGLFCTVSDACTAAAACVGAARSCSDSRPCTSDACDETGDACTNTLTAGNCLIAGLCRVNNEINPTNQCEACRTAASTSSWSPRVGSSCNDGLYCTVSDVCSGSASCGGVLRNCADAYACTADTCDEGAGACDNALMSGFCFISGGCYASAELDPGNQCQLCSPSSSTSAWTPRTGAACNDNLYCSVSETCTAGAACAGSARDCSDPYACTTDSCNEVGDACVNTLSDGCLIGMACYSSGALNPGNSCLECNPGVSTSAWTARTGVMCTDGLFCTVGDACTAGGACAGSARSCSDPLACTSDTCNEGTDTCDFTLMGGFCSIAGACYASGTVNPVNPCEICTPAASTTSWTARTGTRCDDGSVAGCGACDGSGTCATGTTCSDAAPCTTDTCNDATGVCSFPATAMNCVIGGSCYADGTVNASNPCQVCDPLNSTTAWTPRTGSRCNDGSPAGCGVCNGSAVCATATTCSDGLACTTDACDDSTGVCGQTLLAGWCSVAMTCFANTTVNPSETCQWCDTSMSTSSWTPRIGTRCDDMSAPGCGVCGAAGSCATSSTCSDGLSCTTDTCTDATGVCTSSATAGSCAISGACYATGAVNAGNSCQWCDPAVSTTTWSARVGVRCNDGAPAGCGMCNGSGTCATNTTCSDGLSCTGDTCDDATGNCTYPISSGCLIAAACWADGAVNPMNPCQVCTVATSTTAWSARTGVRCTDASVPGCGVCDAGGSCATSTTCSDGLSCTTDTCDDASGSCTAPVSTGCAIAGACYASGNVNPSNPCESCQPMTSATSWSPRTGSPCNDASIAGCGQCNTLGVCGTASTCSDGVSCTTDTCADDAAGTCSYPVSPGSCQIAGACYATGTVNVGNACEWCDPAVSATSWSPRTGTRCNDGSLAGCGSCNASGTCLTASTCSDGLSCTSDACDDPTGTCSAPINAGTCLISGTCRGTGDVDASNSCQSCQPATSQVAWSPRTGVRCTDASVPGCGACTAAATCTTSTTCTDVYGCTTDTCDDATGACTYPIVAGSCLIASACWASGTVNPGNSCQVCTPASSTTMWTARVGVRCNDGTVAGCGQCNAAATCAATSTCTDVLSCTTDTCDDATGACTYPIAAGSCLIGGACYANGTANGACQVCDSAANPTGWTNRPSTTRCDDGGSVTCGFCNGAGSCAVGPSCSDSFTCTTDSCNDTNGACTNSINAGTCLIAGTCRGTGDVDASNACQSCQPASSQTLWTPRTGVRCTDASVSGCGTCTAAATCTTSSTCSSDGYGCTTDTCDDATGACSYPIVAGSCLIASACWASGAINPANSCQICTPASSTTAWTARVGVRCDDASVAGCGMCNAAATCGTGSMCASDSLSCTTDTCDDATGACSYPLGGGSCLIAGACYANGAANGPCQVCDSVMNPIGWTNRPGSTRCDDGAAVTCGFCSSGTCAASASCSDGLTCTTDSCNDTNGACTNSINAGNCSIAGVCYVDGTANGSCQYCNAGSSPSAWTNRPTSAFCDDGLAPTCGRCNGAGACGGPPLSCDDGLSCTTDTCTDATSVCNHPLNAGSCLVSMACYANGTVNPGNACQVCDTATSTTMWTSRTGVACDDGSAGTCMDTCNAASTCIGVALINGYVDADGDGYGDAGSPSSYCPGTPNRTTDNTDCRDESSDVHPGQTAFFTTPAYYCAAGRYVCGGGTCSPPRCPTLAQLCSSGACGSYPLAMAWWDYDCNGTSELEPVVASACSVTCTPCGTGGWSATDPPMAVCGDVYDYRSCGSGNRCTGGCVSTISPRTRGCR